MRKSRSRQLIAFIASIHQPAFTRLFAAIIILLVIIAHSTAQREQSAFSRRAFYVASLLRSGSLLEFKREVSSHGLTVIDRKFEKATEGPPVTIVWQEEVTQFRSGETGDRALMQPIERFSKVVRDTTGDFRKVVRVSENLSDHWNFGYLGASIEGRIAANAYWYIRFIREDGKWKVWCLEEIDR